MSSFLDERLTIVLTIKGRDKFTKRWLAYMNEVRCPYKILIADGGGSQELRGHLRQKDNYPNLFYEYYEYPFDLSFENFYRKLENIYREVSSKYIIQADNDDFFVLSEFSTMLDFLDSNAEFVAVRGQLIDLEVYSPAGDSRAVCTGVAYDATTRPAPSIDSDCESIRVRCLCEGFSKWDYYANWYAITRTETFKKITYPLWAVNFKEIIFLEVIYHVLLVNFGKVKIFPGRFYIRQRNTSQLGDALVMENEFLERCVSFNSMLELHTFLGSCEYFEDKEYLSSVSKSIAIWFETFVYNIRRQRESRTTLKYRIYRAMTRFYVLRKLTRMIRFNFMIHTLKFSKESHQYMRRSVSLPEVKNFVVK